MGADALRAYDGAPGLFTGIDGASVPIGVMDTGLNVAHWDIAAHRDSICGANFVPDASLFEEEDLWNDADGHGTHVTGTVAGNGFVEQRYAGMAPGVRHIRFAKVLSLEGWGWGSYSDNGMDFLAEASGCETAGAGSERAKALIVNMSLSATWILYGKGATPVPVSSTPQSGAIASCTWLPNPMRGSTAVFPTTVPPRTRWQWAQRSMAARSRVSAA